jgi:hypothetical protein
MAKSADYVELVAQAERAVAGVKDPELRRAAFEKILDDLLSDRGETAKTKPPKPPKASAAPERKPRKRKGPTAHIEELVEEGFFKKPKTIAQVKAELENRGHHIPMTALSGPLQKLCQRKMLRRQKTKRPKGNKQTYTYSNW